MMTHVHLVKHFGQPTRVWSSVQP